VGRAQAAAAGTSIVPSFLWTIRDRWTVTAPKVVLKVKGRVPALDPGIGFAVPLLKDQFLIGLLDEDLKSRRWNSSPPDERRPRSGREMLVLRRHGQGHLHGQFQRECLVYHVDGWNVMVV